MKYYPRSFLSCRMMTNTHYKSDVPYLSAQRHAHTHKVMGESSY